MTSWFVAALRLLVLVISLSVIIPVVPAKARYQGTDLTCVTGTAGREKLSVWSRPSSNSERVGRLAADACGMNVESIEGDWTYIRGTDHKGQNIEGWVDNRYLRPAGSSQRNAENENGGSSAFPIEAASGGGVVRAGPGTDYRKVASTGQFQRITVVRKTDIMMNGYPWFEIRFSGGRKGYQWGGIICSTDQPFTGTFDECENFRRSLSGNRAPPAPQERHVTYSCNEGIPLVVTFVDRANESYALYSHDSGPKNRVSSIPSGSGFAYSNGYHELRGKGTNIDLIEGGNTIDSCRAD